MLAPSSGGGGKGGDLIQPAQLYNLGETKSLAAAQPERVTQMQALLKNASPKAHRSHALIPRNDRRSG